MSENNTILSICEYYGSGKNCDKIGKCLANSQLQGDLELFRKGCCFGLKPNELAESLRIFSNTCSDRGCAFSEELGNIVEEFIKNNFNLSE